ncbi:MAG: alpha-N-acetylglucosaminidase C-terminal domain-containing protein, partial [Verrucomicrobiae bacterium]|nr:alpha-N-acetylglucosaminidase C-terminal domain-containing protein [Verrucomicrobiae bacterium]
ALHGINQAYLLTGHEKVWQNTLRRLGFSDPQIETWLPSTSHISWWHFDNLQGYGGPLGQHEIDNEAALARQVADRMRELGIEPVTMGFYGMVPDFFATRFPAAHIIPQGNWVGGFVRPPVLDPSDPVFATTAAIYYEELESILGPVRFYGGDLFHEGGNTGGLNLGTAYRAIQNAMRAHRPDAGWVMFGWTGNPRQEGLDSCVPDHVLVQQTSKHLGTAMPVSGSFRNYGGWIPWTWQIIDNFGGNHGLYGNFDTIATLPSRFLDGGVPGNFQGIGHSPEGIGTNPLQTALYYDMFWRDADVDVSGWLDETITARYGASSSSARAAWDMLARSSYRCPVEQEGICDLIFATRPRAGATKARTWSANTPYWCELDIVEAWRLLLQAAPQLSGNANFRHDLVDVTRHAMNVHSKRVYDEMMAAFELRDQAVFDERSAELLTLFDELDAVLGSAPNFLLGTWLEAAKAKGDTPAAKARIERNARDLVTLWDGKQDELDDYGSRSWAGLVGSHYKTRWTRYIADLRGAWSSAGTPAYSGIDLELAFLDDRTVFPTTPSGDTVALSQAVYDRLSDTLRATASLRWSLPQEETAPVVLSFDVTERIVAGEPLQVRLTRDHGNATTVLQRIAIVSGTTVLHEDPASASLDGSTLLREIPPLSPPPGGRVILELTLQGPGNHAIANGSIELGVFFSPAADDYVGRFRYSVAGSSYHREFHADGTLKLYVDGVEYGPWAGFTWEFVNGEAHCFRSNGTLFERHRLDDPATLVFQVDSQYGPALRIPAAFFYQQWADALDLGTSDAGPDDDFDNDGLCNFGEFAFGTDIRVPDRAFETTNSGGSLVVTWKQRADADLESLRYHPQHSTDLEQWSAWPSMRTGFAGADGYTRWEAVLPVEP